jgi:aminopeptidase N
MTTWRWREDQPMASYLATATIGRFRTRHFRTSSGLRVYRAVDASLFSQRSDPSDPSSPSLGRVAVDTFDLIPAQLRLLSRMFGPYPFDDAGGIAVDAPIRFALENQTRPIYAPHWFEDPFVAPIVQIHELAHEWYGDSVSVHHWRDIWLNEGFATYSEWLWLADLFEDHTVPQAIFDDLYSGIPADDPFWDVVVADPGVQHQFDDPVYARGAMALQAVRDRIGDRDFFDLLRRWASCHAYGTGSTPQFTRLAEQISGEDLGALFHSWLWAPAKPSVPHAAAIVTRTAATDQGQCAATRWSGPFLTSVAPDGRTAPGSAGC